MRYWQEGISAGLVRFDGTTYEMYDHGRGTWGTHMPSVRVMSEVLHSGNWYDVSEDEVRFIIEGVATRASEGSGIAGTDSQTALLETAEWIEAPAATPLEGAEAFVGTPATVLDFWRFAMSDLRTNNLRGYLAEFLVAQAVGATQRRVEWDAFDVTTPAGVKIEVKASGYLQAWAQRRHSAISFSGLRAKTWTPQAGYAPQASYNADVYVFCVQTARTHDEYNPLDVKQWDFYVMPRETLVTTGLASMTLSGVRALVGEAVRFDDLGKAIDSAARSTLTD